MQRKQATDEAVMLELQRGDRSQLTLLLRRHADALLAFIHRTVRDRHRAEELFQDVFLAVWIGRHSFQRSGTFRPWLFGIAVNKCRAELRRSTRLSVVGLNYADEAASPGPTPESAADAAETAHHVQQAVDRLPDNQRTAVVLRLWSGLAYSEIAQAMGVAEGTVRSHMFHALKTMRNYLEPRLR